MGIRVWKMAGQSSEDTRVTDDRPIELLHQSKVLCISAARHLERWHPLI